MAKQMICSSCGTVGTGKKMMKGHFMVEGCLWLCFLIPGLIYTMWRANSRPAGVSSGIRVCVPHTRQTTGRLLDRHMV